MNSNRRPSGIEGLGDMAWGTHFCLFYETREDLLDFFIPFFKAGLEHQELCLCVASEPLMAEEAEQAMREAFPDFDRYLAEGQLEITPHTDWYLKEGPFDEQRVLQGWIDKLDQALSKGFSGLRFAANILLEKRDWMNFAGYEGKLEETLRDLRIAGLCAYNLNRYSAANVLDVMRHHQFTLARRDGAWEPLEGAQLKRTHEEVPRMNNELEQRVAERTVELAAANEQLRREIIERERSEARLQAAIDAADIGLWDWDLASGQIIWLGDHEKLFGFPPGEFDGTYSSFEKRIHPEDLEELNRVVQRARYDGSEYSHEYRVVWPDGSIHWINGRGKFIYNQMGQPVRMYGAVLEFTERKQAEEALRKSERVLREAESLGHTGSWEQDLVTGEIFNTEENLRLFFGDDRSKGTPFEDYAQAVHPDDREFVMRRRGQLLEGGPGDIEYRVVWPDGSVHVLFGRATVVRDESGKPIRVYGTNVDITERTQAEEALKESEAKLKEAQKIAKIGYFDRDPIADRITCSEETARIFGLEPYGGVRSQAQLQDLIHPDDRQLQKQALNEALQGSQLYDVEYRIVRPDGDIRFVHTWNQIVYEESGKPIRIFGTLQDITELKQAEEEIRRYAARMEALAEISRTFVEAGLDYQSVLNTVAKRTAELIGDACVMTLFSDDQQRSYPVAFYHPDPKALAMMHEALMHTWQGGTDTQRYQALLSGNSIFIPEVNSEEFRTSLEPEFRDFFDVIGISSFIIVPLQVQDRVIGTLGVTRDRHGAAYTPDDQVLLQNLADRAALTIQNARLFDQVEGARERLQALSRRLLEVQEAERRALTTELHDRVGQNLTGLSINLQNMKALLSGEAAQALSAKFDDAQALVEDTSRQIRDIMAELHLPELEDYGLAAALDTYAERAASRGNLELIADLPDLQDPPLPSDVRIALFRAAQEAISNVLKHANATQLEVSLEKQDGRIRLRIEDDGQGFESEAAPQKEAQTWGLKIMRERIESIGGKVQIESQPSEGTRVTFEIERPQ